MATQILLNPIGSAGDVFPFLALGQELQKRGHHVAVMTNPMFIEHVGQANLEFIEVGTTEALRRAGTDPSLHRPGNAWKLALRWGAVGTFRQSFEIIRQRIEKCETMVVAPCLGFGARTAAEKFKIPLATVVLSPFLIRSKFDSPVIRPMVLGKWVPKATKQLQFWIADRCVIDPILSSDINSLRRDYGLPSASRYLHRWCFSDDLNLALFPEFFAPRQLDWPAHTAHAGLIHWDPPIDPQLLRELNQFIDLSEQPPIVVMAGSAGPGSPKFYESWIQATHQLGRGMILLEKNHSKVPPLPDHVFYARYIPVDDILPRAALIAHGGGVGTTLRSLQHGIPQLLFPKVNDQPDNAARIRRLGTGKILNDKRATANRIATLVQDITQDAQLIASCKRSQAEFTHCNPLKIACDLIESTFARFLARKEINR